MAKVLITGTSMLVVAALLAILNQKLSAKLYGDQHSGKDFYDDQHEVFVKISTMAKIFMMRISTKVFMMMMIDYEDDEDTSRIHLSCSRHHDKNEEENGDV